MRIIGAILLFGLTLFAQLVPAQAQIGSWFETQADKRLKSLRSALRTIRLVPVERSDGSYSYYDIVAENVCTGEIAGAAQAWLHDYGNFFLNRVVVVNAVILFPGERAPKTIPLLTRSNFDSRTVCLETPASGIRRQHSVKINLEVITTTGLSEDNAKLVRGAITGITSAIGAAGAWGKAASTVIEKAAPEAATLKRILTKNVPDRTDVFSFGAQHVRAEIGSRDAPLMSFRKVPRTQLLAVRPGEEWNIPASVDDIGLKSWKDIVAAAEEKNDWRESESGLRGFCVALRRELLSALRNDPLATALGLWYHDTTFGASYAKKGTECASERDKAELTAAGFGPRKFTS